MRSVLLLLALGATACEGPRTMSDAGPGADAVFADALTPDVTAADTALPDTVVPDTNARDVTLPDTVVSDAVFTDLVVLDVPPPPTVYCGHPADCSNAQHCDPDGTCHPGPCSSTAPCIFGYACATDGQCEPLRAGACDGDGECSGGACPAGVCLSADALCLDASQCAAGSVCVEGRCTPACRGDADCRDGLRCEVALKVCSLATKTCAITNDCGGPAEVCAGGVCRPRSLDGACANPGDVWFENGCVPDPLVHGVCAGEGVQDVCAVGSLCLAHVCWRSCDGPLSNACAVQPVLNQCKPLSTASGTHNVCATAANLGGQCSFSAPCSAGTCIDGFCR